MGGLNDFHNVYIETNQIKVGNALCSMSSEKNSSNTVGK